jgi:mRNA interferase MazF
MPDEQPPLRRGQIWWLSWEPARGSEQRGRRPGLIVQTDSFNRSRRYANTIAVALSTAAHDVPVHVTVEPSEQNGLSKRSYVMGEHLMTVSRERLDGYMGELDSETMTLLDTALKLILSLR